MTAAKFAATETSLTVTQHNKSQFDIFLHVTYMILECIADRSSSPQIFVCQRKVKSPQKLNRHDGR